MTLSSNWFTEGYIDFELKQYTLLAYLQKVDSLFREKRLYTSLSELISHYHNLSVFKVNAHSLEEHFHKELKGIDLTTKRLTYSKKEISENEIEELKDIVEFSIKEIKNRINIGTELFDEVESHLLFFDVGIVSLNKDEGYLVILFLNDFYVYRYFSSPLVLNDEQFNSLRLTFIEKIERNFLNTFQSIKLALIKKESCAVYGSEFIDISYPFQETVLPIIKRKFLGFLKKETI